MLRSTPSNLRLAFPSAREQNKQTNKNNGYIRGSELSLYNVNVNAVRWRHISLAGSTMVFIYSPVTHSLSVKFTLRMSHVERESELFV